MHNLLSSTMFQAAKKLTQKQAAHQISVHIFVDSTVDGALRETIKELFIPQSIHAQVVVRRVPQHFSAGATATSASTTTSTAGASDPVAGTTASAEPKLHPLTADVCLVLSARELDDVATLVSRYAKYGVPTAVVARTSVEAPHAIAGAVHNTVGIVCGTDPETLTQKLACWVVDTLDEKISAFVQAFPFARKEKIRQLVANCASQNAMVGAVAFIPGADMPVITANQLRLALDIAQLYDKPLDASRLPELGCVVGAGVVYRGIARSLVGVLPVVGPLIKASVGYGGTISTGRTLEAYFERTSKTSNDGDLVVDV